MTRAEALKMAHRFLVEEKDLRPGETASLYMAMSGGLVVQIRVWHPREKSSVRSYRSIRRGK